MTRDKPLERLFANEIQPLLGDPSIEGGYLPGRHLMPPGGRNVDWCASDIRALFLDAQGLEVPPDGDYLSGGVEIPGREVVRDYASGWTMFLHRRVDIGGVPGARFSLLYDKATGGPLLWERVTPSPDGRVVIGSHADRPLMSSYARPEVEPFAVDEFEAVKIALAA